MNRACAREATAGKTILEANKSTRGFVEEFVFRALRLQEQRAFFLQRSGLPLTTVAQPEADKQGTMAQAQLRSDRRKIWRKRRRRPGDPEYYSVIGGNGHWQPNKQLRELGFRNVACGPDNAEARAKAEYVNRQATAARAVQDAARAVENADTPPAAYKMQGAWSEVNAEHLQREQPKFEKFEAQTVPYRPPVRVQTRPPANWLKWLLGQ